MTPRQAGRYLHTALAYVFRARIPSAGSVVFEGRMLGDSEEGFSLVTVEGIQQDG